MNGAALTVDGINVTRWGSGTTVLMIHGSAQGNPATGADHWTAQRPLADEGWELVLPDRPGHGLSPSRGPEDLEKDAVWVAEMLGDGAHLVGHSYGGATALCAAGLRPQAVMSLTLIEAPIFSIAENRPEAMAFRARLEDAMATRNPVGRVIKFSRNAGIPRGLIKPRPTLRQMRRMGQGARTMRNPWTWDATGPVERIRDARVPSLLVTGGWSPGFATIADELADRLDGEHVIIEAGHHVPQLLDEGRKFNEVLGRFLDAQRESEG